MKPRLHLGVCGIGYGHAFRASILVRELSKRGWSISVSSYGDGLRYLRSLGIDAKPSPPISYGVLPEGKVSIKLTIYRNILLPVKFLEQVSCELGYAEDADLIISDSRVSTVLAAKLLGKPALTILNQFNIRVEYPRYRRLIELVEAVAQAPSRIWGLSNMILVADYPPPYTISKQSLVMPERLSGKVSFMGPITERLEVNPSREALCEKYGLDPSGGPIILYHASGPSYERRILTNLILPMLEKLAEEYQIVATLGGDELKDRLRRVKAYRWVENPLELFEVSDLVICRAGQTTLAKALACGKPLVMIPIPAHGEQLGNALSVTEQGAGIILDQERLSVEALRKAVKRILSSRSFYERAGDYRHLAEKLNPIEKICSKLLNLIG